MAFSFPARYRRAVALSVLTFSAGASLALFQNCTASKSTKNLTASASGKTLSQSVSGASCTFNGVMIPDGAEIEAYQSATSDANGICKAQLRICNDGTLSGSYSFPSCQVVVQQRSCDFNGRSIAHGERVTAYLNSSVAYGGQCAAQERVCDNGTLSGSYTFASCDIGQPAACMFNGQTVAHGAEVTAFLTSSVPKGSTCASEKRRCDNGALSGSYTFGACQPDQAASCVFDGKAVASGAFVEAFKTSTVPFGKKCESQKRSCVDGKLSGTFKYGSCAPESPKACIFNGETIPHGGKVKAFLRGLMLGGRCQAQERVCNNGKLSGRFRYASCTNTGACLFNGLTIPTGSSVMAFKAPEVRSNRACVFQKRTCVALGLWLTGSYSYPSCTQH